jgi:hypothetical protein
MPISSRPTAPARTAGDPVAAGFHIGFGVGRGGSQSGQSQRGQIRPIVAQVGDGRQGDAGSIGQFVQARGFIGHTG